MRHWVSSYPRQVPCLIAGCEVTIPHRPIKDFAHKERDDEIRALCEEVLLRSKSIGVRGHLTQEYLIEFLGYDSHLVDLIYDDDSPSDLDRIRAFLKKNGLSISNLERVVANFSKSPRIFYDRPIKYCPDVRINSPYVETFGDVARLSAEIIVDGKSRTLWCETPANFSNYLLHERSDAFLCALLPWAMRAGKNIVSEAPVSEYFLHNVNEVLVPNLSNNDHRLFATRVMASSDSSSLRGADAVATAMSCGVDSFFTALQYTDPAYSGMKLSHLYCGNYLYGNASKVYDRAAAVADRMAIPLVKTTTNINELFEMPHLFTHFYKAMFGVLSLKKLFKTYYYSSAGDFGVFNMKDNSLKDTINVELLLLYAFSGPDFQVVTGGGKYNRVQKTRAIASSSIAQHFLNVCLYPERDRNCGKCGKCRRTMLTLDMLGQLDKFSAVFDVSEYSDDIQDHMSYLVSQKASPMLADVYSYFKEFRPDLIAKAGEHA